MCLRVREAGRPIVPKTLVLTKPCHKHLTNTRCGPGLCSPLRGPVLFKIKTLLSFPHLRAVTAEVHRGSVICSASYQLVNYRPRWQAKVSLTLSPVSLLPKSKGTRDALLTRAASLTLRMIWRVIKGSRRG